MTLRFNRDGSYFTMGTSDGFSVFRTKGFQLEYCRSLEGGCRLVEMLDRTNILVLVGSGQCPKYPPNKVLIWNDRSRRVVRELCFQFPVLGLRISQDFLYVILREEIYLYELDNPNLIGRLTTTHNRRALLALNQSGHIFVFPHPEQGQIMIQRLNGRILENGHTQIKAHENEVCQITLSLDGHLVATASEQGTLIRVFETTTGTKLHEFRRGMERAEIYNLIFDDRLTRLVCSSNHGTIHIFSLSDIPHPGKTAPIPVPTVGRDVSSSSLHSSSPSPSLPSSLRSSVSSIFSYFTRNIPIIKDQWSYKQYHLPTDPNVCAFNQDCLAVIYEDGRYFLLSINDELESGQFL